MDLYYNNQKVASIPISAGNTIGQVKKILSDWLVPQGVTNYTIRLLFNNGTELSTVVFESNQYDTMNFQAQTNLLNGGQIHVMSKVSQAQVQQTEVKDDIKQTQVKDDIQREYTRDELNKMKIPELKDILKQQGKKISGSKTDLIDRIVGNIQQTRVQQAEVKQPEVKKTDIKRDLPKQVTGTVYAIKEDDDYTGFTTKEDAYRWWLDKQTDVDLEEVGLFEPIDYDNEDEHELLEQLMDDNDAELIEITMVN